jgi:hypothetical protein
MDRHHYRRLALVLSAGGVAFSGYLSGVRFFSNSCAFAEPCPMFFGMPACYFGFAMFVALLGVSVAALRAPLASDVPVLLNAGIAGLGSIFAGSFAVAELRHGLTTYGLGVSTCVYGALFFLAILATSLTTLLRHVPRTT